LIGRRIIEAGIKLDEGLADLLKFQVRTLKELVKSGSPIDEIQKANALLRDIIIALSLTEEKIRSGILLCEKDDEE
jgi:phage terminase Nu1 subunit (DNA packaging protein)